MKTPSKTLTAALTSIAVLALPAGAAAGPADVRERLSGAENALDRAESHVEGNQDAKAALQMARANVLTRKAGREAGEIGKAKKAAKAQRSVAAQFDANAATISALVDELRARFQVDAVDEVETAVDGRTKAVEVLTALLDRLPSRAVPGIAKAIAAITTDGEETEELTSALESGELSDEAQVAVAEALANATTAVQSTIEHLSSLVGTLPPEAQPHVQAALEQVQQHLGAVVEMLGGLFGGGVTSPSGAGSAGAGAPAISLPAIPGVPSGPAS